MRPGEVIADRYELECNAAKSGMGIVYRARDRYRDRPVALKVVREHEIESVERFSAEIELLAQLEHPHIVSYVTHGLTKEGLPFLVMPWLEGEDLHQRLQSAPLTIDEVIRLARGVASALAYLHERGFVHRDLKPSNIFLPARSLDDVKLLDFGIARAIAPTRQITSLGMVIGTPGYMAPEQARGDSMLTSAVDVFAMGCVLFECLTGRPLFSGSHAMAILAKVLLEEPPRVRELRSGVPPQLDDLVRSMVDKNPERRPADGGQVHRYLDDMAMGQTVPTPLSLSASRLTGAEQRVVTLLVAVLPPSSDASSREGAPREAAALERLCAAADKFAVRVDWLADGTAIAAAMPGYDAADQAALLARFARYIAASAPNSTVAIATGRAVTHAHLPVGEAIDRGVKIVRSADMSPGVHLDDATAALITSRFRILRDGTKLTLNEELRSLDPMRPLLGCPTPCVGRERELAIMQATFLECVQEGGARAVLVTAAPGIGKSRLRHEFVRRLEAQPSFPAVWQCRGDPLHGATPYELTAQIIRQALGLHPGEPPESTRGQLEKTVAELLPPDDARRVAEFLGELIGTPFDDDGRLQLRAARKSASAMVDQIRRAFEDWIRARCKLGPVVLVMEDLHWADTGSTKLIDNVLRKLRTEPLLILAFARPEVHERFPALWKERDVVIVRLPPLPARACSKLAREVLGEDAPESQIVRIVERSEGNAFFLEELIRATVEGAPAHLPETVLAVAQARLERMSQKARKLLRAASIYGEMFWQEGVSVLIEDDASSSEVLLANLVENEVIVRREGSRFPGKHEYAFRHALLRTAAYETLTDDDRRLGHRLAADWLDGMKDEPEAVALHWLEAVEHGRAAACFERAGRTHWSRAKADAAARCAARALLFTDARHEAVDVTTQRMRLLTLALDVTRGLDGREVVSGIERHTSLPEGVDVDSPTDGVLQFALSRIAAASRKSPSAAAMTEAIALAACAFGSMADLPRARALFCEASSLATGEPSRLQKVERLEAKVACWAGEFGRADDLLSRVAWSASDDLDESAEALMWLASATVAIGGKNRLAHALDYVSRAEALASSVTENPVLQVLCYKTRFLCFFFAGDHASAASSALDGVEVARRGGLRFEESLHLHNLGEQYVRMGDSARARRALTDARHLAAEVGVDWLEVASDVLIAYLDGVEGNREADRRLEAHAEKFRCARLTWLELHARYWLGMLLSARKDARARVELTRARDIARQLAVRIYEDDCVTALDAAPPVTSTPEA